MRPNRKSLTGVLAAVGLGVSLLASAPNAAAAAPATATPILGAQRCTSSLPVGTSSLTVSSSGVDRTVLVHVPERVKGVQWKVPLVLTLHGSFSNAQEQLQRSELAATAEEEGFLVAAPQGAITYGPGLYAWNVPGVTSAPAGQALVDDEQFLRDTVAALATLGCADPSRVVATGYSGGGRMISQWACDDPASVAAIVPVVGLRAGTPLADGVGGFTPDPASCQPSAAVRVVAFSGMADPVNPYAGGGAPYWGYGTEVAQDRWAELNDCAARITTRQLSEHVTVRDYRQCRRDARVTLYAISDAGHTWPGSGDPFTGLGLVSQEIRANDVIADLVRTQR